MVRPRRSRSRSRGDHVRRDDGEHTETPTGKDAPADQAAATKHVTKKKTTKKKATKKTSTSASEPEQDGATKKKVAKTSSASASEEDGATKKKATKKKATAKKKTTKKKAAAKKTKAAEGQDEELEELEEAEDGGAKVGRKNGKSLVIVESPAKAKTINKFLGKDYVVVASMGHVRDLPKSVLGIDIEHEFEPSYEPLAEKKKVISDLRKYATGASTVYLACDMDREGEAIAWHISELLKDKKREMKRVTFNQITEAAIQKAFEEPRDLDMNKVNAQQARRILDRIVGYKLSQLLWKKVRRGLSAGRVQSVAVKMVVEREKEIDAFNPVEYWELTGLFDSARLRAGAPEPAPQEGEDGEDGELVLPPWRFQAGMVQLRGNKLDPAGFRVKNEQEAFELKAKLEQAPFTISQVTEKETKRNPKAPFITSTLQQAASTRLSFGAERTMRIAQQLYEGVDVGAEGGVGLITYMRTDSFALAPEAVEEARAHVRERHGDEYVPEKPPTYRRGKLKVQAQEAHEAIRPTDVNRDPETLKKYLTKDQLKVYKLIWERFVTSQMSPARFKNLTVEVTGRLSDAEGDAAVFRASGQTLLFDGFLRVTGGDQSDRLLPDLKQDEDLALAPDGLEATQKFTKPPARYNEASLVKKLEDEGIGRPSTYASIISTVQKRGYVEQRNRALYATTKGRIVTDKLEEFFRDIMDYKYTRDLERDLDRVESAVDESGDDAPIGSRADSDGDLGDDADSDDAGVEAAYKTLEALDWRALLQDFYGVFSADLDKARDEMAHVNESKEETEFPCPTCGKKMVKLYNTREFSQFLGCPDYPECKTTVPLDDDGKPAPTEESEETCPKCEKNLQIKSGRRGKFFACSGYPDCKQTFEIGEDGKPVPRPEVEAPCPECETPMVVRHGRLGAFLGCPTYPKCRGTLPLIKKEDGTWEVGQKGEAEGMPKVDVKCERCGSGMAIKRSRRGPFLGCTAFPKCRGTAKMPEGIELPKPPAPKPAGEDCEQCGKPMVIRAGRRGSFIACTGYPECRNTKNVEAPAS